ncbi:PilW family protein [Chitinibacter sp. GC72]|uniref:PilW family protein n=1 Tax=Chitinibacter sp. GC72 TaxID=1526917 RepID=UPI0012F8A5DA|nr:prepilin-type N-terminal cleavage/methylation domain-containing protein [Chitinibacter sp. GC72]
MPARHPSKQSGFTLVEILVALALGLLVVGAAFGYFLSTLQTSKSLLSQSKLQQDIRSTTTLMQRDIRRAGYRPESSTAATKTTVGTVWVGKTVSSLAKDNCIIYRYVDERANLRNSGFLLHTDGKIYMKTAGTDNTCSLSSDWSEVTSARNVEITSFQIDYFGNGNRPRVLISLESRLSNDITVKLPINLQIVLPNAPNSGSVTSGT